MKSLPQAGLFDESSRHGRFLEFKIRENCNVNAVKNSLKKLMDFSSSIDELYLQFAFGSNFWDRINPTWRPKELISFKELNNDLLPQSSFNMPASQGDILIWLHSSNSELLPQVLLLIYQVMEAYGNIQLDLEGIKNIESRDLIGFVDGTANPKDDNRMEVALIPDGEKGAGGSYVLSQRWQHDLKAFNHLSVAEQEKVVGRTKVDDIELEGEAMPEDSHVSRTDAKVNGKAMKIYRRSSPYIASQLGAQQQSDHGLYFFAFAGEMQPFTVQLERMMGLSTDGLVDQLMYFSQAKTGSFWFMPNQLDLLDILQ